jgi:hypothetical protein
VFNPLPGPYFLVHEQIFLDPDPYKCVIGPDSNLSSTCHIQEITKITAHPFSQQIDGRILIARITVANNTVSAILPHGRDM